MALCRTAGAGKVKGDQYYNPHEQQHHTLNVADCKHKDIFKTVIFLIWLTSLLDTILRSNKFL